MHETSQIELALRDRAERMSQRYNGAPVVIIVGATGEGPLKRTMVGSSFKDARLRDFLGLIHIAAEIVTRKHFDKNKPV